MNKAKLYNYIINLYKNDVNIYLTKVNGSQMVLCYINMLITKHKDEN